MFKIDFFAKFKALKIVDIEEEQRPGGLVFRALL